MKRLASSSAALWMSNAEQINTWKSLKRITRHNLETRGTAPPKKVAKINKGRGILARANVEDVSSGVCFAGRCKCHVHRGSAGGGGWNGKALVSQELRDLSVTGPRPRISQAAFKRDNVVYLCDGDSVSDPGSPFQGFTRSGSIFHGEDKSGRNSLVEVMQGRRATGLKAA